MEMSSCSSSFSDMAHAKKDHSVATIGKQQLEHLEFYGCVVGKGLFCKTCASFSGISSPGVPYITKAVIFGDHHLRGSTCHLESVRHNGAVKNLLANAKHLENAS